MEEESYSFKTLIIENGRNIRGILTLSLDKYEFNDISRKVNWEKIDLITGTTKVKSFFFSTEKPFVMIKTESEDGPIFIMNLAQREKFIQTITELKQKSKEIREKEEQRREEEEKRRKIEEQRHIEEQRKREEERRQKEIEERKRQEEERRKKEEEDKRQLEEQRRVSYIRLVKTLSLRQRHMEEQKRLEEARKKREEEERLAHEALERMLKERKDRIAGEVEISLAEEEKIISIKSESYVKKATGYFLDNPYRIIGISCISTKEEANDSFEKIKKLVRLKAISSFKTSYHLKGTEKPNRDISIVQNSLTILKDNKYKWFWFAEPDACTAWQNENYRKELICDGNEYGTYDQFLANYMYGVFLDSEFKKKTIWRLIFRYYTYMIERKDINLLKSRFNKVELSNLNNSEILNSFCSEIFKPIEALIENDNIMVAVRLYKIIQEESSINLEELRRTVTGRIGKWFSDREEKVKTYLKEFEDMKTITSVQANIIKRKCESYTREMDKVIESVLTALKSENVRYEMIKESYRSTTWEVMFILNKAIDKTNAILFANKTYPYCNDEDKRKVRNTFGFSSIKGCDKDVTNAEWDIMGDNYYNGEKGYPIDYYQAFYWYKKAAEAGNKYSMNSIGICYKEGKGIYQSDYEAAKWFEKAYRAGNPDGTYNLANCYASGKGKYKDTKKAMDLFIEAANQGHPNAADAGKRLLDLMIVEQKIHRLTQHHHYDLGFQMPIGEIIMVEVTLNYSANVYLMDEDNYQKYIECEAYTYYGGRATQTPYRVKIPSTGHWHLVVDNGDEMMTAITSSVQTRRLNF